MEDANLLIEKFYTHFQKKDWKGMQSCYHDKVVFSDPVFQNLKGDEARAMWHMLAIAGKDLTITFTNIKANGLTGSCDWDAHYTFSRSGRKVHNIIHAEFEFSEGKIIRHRDRFNFWRWSGMALGISGTLLGWSGIIRSKVRTTAGNNLKKFMTEHPEYTP